MEISKIKLNNINYDIKDSTTREQINSFSVVQTLTQGIEIGKVNGVSLYSPDGSGGSVVITNTLPSGVLIATINGINIYAPDYTDADGVSY